MNSFRGPFRCLNYESPSQSHASCLPLDETCCSNFARFMFYSAIALDILNKIIAFRIASYVD